MKSNGAAGRWALERRLGYPLITEVAPAPDGERVLFAAREPIMTDDRSEFITQLYVVARGAEPLQLTFGEANNGGGRWSPDGQHLAFLSKRSGRSNVWVMRANGGEAWPLTKYDKSDVSAIGWSPDGDRIAFLMAAPPTEEREQADKARDDARTWGERFDFAQLYVVPFTVGPRELPEARRLTSGRFQVVGFDWTPDGERIALTHQPTPLADDWPRSRLALVRADGESAGNLTDLGLVAGFGATPKVSPDGCWVACHTSEEPVRWGFAGGITLYPVAGGAPRRLAATPDGQTELIGWSSDGTELYALDWAGTASQLFATPVDGGATRPLTDAATVLTLPSANRRGQIALVGQGFHEPNGVYLLDAAGGGRVERIGAPALPEDWPAAPLPRAEVLRWRAPDGREIEGIVVYPLDESGGGPYPTIVEVHGGPTGIYSRTYLGGIGGYADYAGLAERGYLILRANPRGSSGYGKEFRFANYGDWGGGDYRDIMSGLDSLIERGIADPARLGLLGWSYGGFMTSWTVTQTDRFKAACVGAAVTNPLSFNGTSDIPGFLPDYFGAEGWDDLEPYRRQSPILHAAKVVTPCLIQHGECDDRVPPGQGREFYNALFRRGVPTELVFYPRQGHVVAEPRLLLDMKRRATAWFERWIGGVNASVLAQETPEEAANAV